MLVIILTPLMVLRSAPSCSAVVDALLLLLAVLFLSSVPLSLCSRHTSHVRFSRTLSPCAHTTLWLKVSERARSLHLHVIHDVTCLSVRWLFPCFVFFLSLAPLLALHCLPVLCLAHQLPQCRIRRGLNPVRTRALMSIAPWRCTTLSHFVIVFLSEFPMHFVCVCPVRLGDCIRVSVLGAVSVPVAVPGSGSVSCNCVCFHCSRCFRPATAADRADNSNEHHGVTAFGHCNCDFILFFWHSVESSPSVPGVRTRVVESIRSRVHWWWPVCWLYFRKGSKTTVFNESNRTPPHPSSLANLSSCDSAGFLSFSTVDQFFSKLEWWLLRFGSLQLLSNDMWTELIFVLPCVCSICVRVWTCIHWFVW